MNDVRRKVPFLWSDVKDAVSLQCVASVLFLYCACMSPVITFGGLLGEATKGNIVRTPPGSLWSGSPEPAPNIQNPDSPKESSFPEEGHSLAVGALTFFRSKAVLLKFSRTASEPGRSRRV